MDNQKTISGIHAKIIADSKNEFGNRITTMVVTFPRIILAEFNTHRMFSRNSASSRAIPFEKMVKSVQENPFIPIAYQKNHKGMQGTEYITDEEVINYLNKQWLFSRNCAIDAAQRMESNDCTKQVINRLLEPFMWHTAIVTATEWENFFALRCPQYSIGAGHPDFRSRKDYSNYVTNNGSSADRTRNEVDWLKLNKGAAEIHMMALAEAMWDAYNESTPELLPPGKWHIPFREHLSEQELLRTLNIIDDDNVDTRKLDLDLVKLSTSMCAGVSYTVVGEDGKPASYEKLIARHDMLAKSGHWSPMEHCAQSWPSKETTPLFRISGNFRGFIQYRKMFDNENIT